MKYTVKDRPDLKFTDAIDGNTVYMLLNSHIGMNEDYRGIDGGLFSSELYYWKNQGYNVVVKINSPGGYVTDGWSIIDAIRTTNAETVNIGLAASMGGVCLLFGSKRKAYDYATCMIHAPNGGNKQFLEVIRSQFKNLLETRTKFTPEEITEMMDSGKDYFFDASQMLEKGIVDEIIPTNKTVDMPANASVAEMFAVYNSINLSNNNEEMEIFNKLFGGKTEMESVANAVQLKAEADQLKKENEALKLKVSEMEQKVKDAEKVTNEAKAKELVSQAVKAGKIADKAEVIEAWEKNAITNFDSTKLAIENMAGKVTSVTAFIKDSDPKMTYEELAQKDPQKLAQIAENDPELFAKLQDEYLSSKKK